MIWDSTPWRKELSGIASQLSKISQRRNPSEKMMVSLEKNIMMGFYIIRKLIEANKLSNKTKELKIKVSKYDSLGKPCTKLNWHKIVELFDLSNPIPHQDKLCKICNQIIHSYVFMPMADCKTGPVKRIAFCSDYDRNKHIYEMSLKDVVELFETVNKDYPASVRFSYDEVRKDYTFAEIDVEER